MGKERSTTRVKDIQWTKKNAHGRNDRKKNDTGTS